MKRVAVYCRVSTTEQDISNQREELPKFAKSKGWEIYDTYVDKGISGATIEARPDFKRLLEDMVSKKFDVLLTEAHDRITRTENLEERGLIMQMLIDNNIILFSPTEGLCNLSDFAGEITSTIKFIIAAQERKNIVRRTVSGKKAKLKKGIPAWGGRPLFARSYDKKTEKWTLDKGKAELIKWAASQYLKGGSLREIAKTLTTKHGMKISYDNLIRTFRLRCGDVWTIKFKDGGSADLKVPRILSDVTIRAIQERLKFNKTYNRKDVQKYVLNGFIFCGKCHRALNGQESSVNPANKKYRYKIYRHPMYEKGERCKCRSFSSVSADKIENAVFNTIFENVHDELHFNEMISKLIPNPDEIKSIKGSIKKNKRNIKKIESNLDTLVESVLEGALKKETIKKKESQLLESKKYFENNIKENEERLSILPNLTESKKVAKRIRKSLLEGFGSVEVFLSGTDYKYKREFLHWLFDAVNGQTNLERGIFLKKSGDVWSYGVNGNLEIKTKSYSSDNCYSTKGL